MLRLIILCLFAAMPLYADPNFWKHEWPDTDFSKTSVESWNEIIGGGPPKDGIPALYDPSFVAAGDENLPDSEPVMVLSLEGHKPRAYPIRYLIWHEIVNDTVGRVPVAVTFCPLCNSGIVFDRRVRGRTLHFGVSGKLRNSDMIMYDRETQSWWQQAVGRAIVGDMLGAKLTELPGWMQSWAVFRKDHPDGLVMAQPNYPRDYGRNPYAGYDTSARPFLYNGEMPPHGINPLARVVRVGDRAWPLTRIVKEGRIAEAGVIIEWTKGQASALDSSRIGSGRDIGNIRVFDSGGNNIAHDTLFAFAFHAFWPEGKWMIWE